MKNANQNTSSNPPIYRAKSRTGYIAEAYRLAQKSLPVSDREGYLQFCNLVGVNCLPISVTDAYWTDDERRRVEVWKRYLKHPSTHRIDFRRITTRGIRPILQAHLNLSSTDLGSQKAAEHLARSTVSLLGTWADTPNLHQSLEVPIILSKLGIEGYTLFAIKKTP